MSKTRQRSVKHSFRRKVWLGFFLVCTAVLLFPPWIISPGEHYPTPFRVSWLTLWDFHFLAYQPPDGIKHVEDHSGFCTGFPFKEYKHLNYYLWGIEIAFLGVLATILHLIIRQHAGSVAHSSFMYNTAAALRQKAECNQQGANRQAIKPADKAPAKEQLSAPTSKDGPR